MSSTQSIKKKLLPALLPKPSTSNGKRKNTSNTSAATNKKQKPAWSSSNNNINNNKKILAVTSDPNSYKIPEHFLSPDQPKPRILKSCTRCRKHKTKCNYVQTAPNSCQSCSKKDLSCQFEIVIPTKRSNMIKSLSDSILELRKMVENLVSHEKLLKKICESKGVVVAGLVDIDKIDYRSILGVDENEHLDEYDDEYYDDEEEEEEEEEDDENDDDNDNDDNDNYTMNTTLLKTTAFNTPVTSPSTTPITIPHYKHDLIIPNNDNTPVMTSFESELLVNEDTMLLSPGNNARPIKVS